MWKVGVASTRFGVFGIKRFIIYLDISFTYLSLAPKSSKRWSTGVDIETLSRAIPPHPSRMPPDIRNFFGGKVSAPIREKEPKKEDDLKKKRSSEKFDLFRDAHAC